MTNLNTERLKLALLQESDIEEALELFTEPGMVKFIGPLQNKTPEEYISFLRKKMAQIKSRSGYYWMARLKSTDELIGAVNLTPIPQTNQMQIGWKMKNRFRKQGYGFESAKSALEFAVNERINPVYGVFVEENVASKRILEKLNFSFFEKYVSNDENLLKYRYVYCIDASGGVTTGG